MAHYHLIIFWLSFLILVVLAASTRGSSPLHVEATATIQSRAVDYGPIGGYIPIKWYAWLAGGLYDIASVWQSALLLKRGTKHMLTLPIGMGCMTLGLFLKLPFADHPTSIGMYIIMDTFILLSPCAFLAIQYVLFHRLAMSFNAPVANDCLVVPARHIVKFFLWSDFLTFMLIGNGGGLVASTSQTLRTVATVVVLIGLVLQAVSFMFYTYAILIFGHRMYNRYPLLWSGHATNDPSSIKNHKRWTTIYKVIVAASIGILAQPVLTRGGDGLTLSPFPQEPRDTSQPTKGSSTSSMPSLFGYLWDYTAFSGYPSTFPNDTREFPPTNSEWTSPLLSPGIPWRASRNSIGGGHSFFVPGTNGHFYFVSAAPLLPSVSALLSLFLPGLPIKNPVARFYPTLLLSSVRCVGNVGASG